MSLAYWNIRCCLMPSERMILLISSLLSAPFVIKLSISGTLVWDLGIELWLELDLMCEYYVCMWWMGGCFIEMHGSRWKVLDIARDMVNSLCIIFIPCMYKWVDIRLTNNTKFMTHFKLKKDNSCAICIAKMKIWNFKHQKFNKVCYTQWPYH